MTNTLKLLKKSLMILACLMMVQEAKAGVQTFVLEHREAISHLSVVKGSEVSLKNDHQDAVYNVSLVNVASGKRLANVAEIAAGGSVRLEFGREGIYRLYYSLHPDEGQNANRYVLIDVTMARPA